ncbi:hypothetical protein CUMW_232060 [Citrus unshiu]|nr:hypothetical protein CUMW_232060 [Citrus unshiu]
MAGPSPEKRRICEIPVPAQSLTSKSPYYLESPVNEGWWEGHLLQGLEAQLLFLILEETSDCAIPWPREFRTRQSPFGKGHQISASPYLNLLKLAEIIDEVHLLLLLLLCTPSSTVKVLILSQNSMYNLLRLGGSWTPAIYVNERQHSILKISRDELKSHIHASGNHFSASQLLIDIILNLAGRATSGKETRELQPQISISLKELRLSDDCGSFTRPLHSFNSRYSSLHDNSQSCCCWSFSSSATKD